MERNFVVDRKGLCENIIYEGIFITPAGCEATVTNLPFNYNENYRIFTLINGNCYGRVELIEKEGLTCVMIFSRKNYIDEDVFVQYLIVDNSK